MPGRVSWRALLAMLHNSSRSSAFFRATAPVSAAWDDDAHLLATIADSLRWLVWAKTEDGQHNRRRPTPIPRPGETAEPDPGVTRYGTTVMTIEQANEFLGWG